MPDPEIEPPIIAVPDPTFFWLKMVEFYAWAHGQTGKFGDEPDGGVATTVLTAGLMLSFAQRLPESQAGVVQDAARTMLTTTLEELAA